MGAGSAQVLVRSIVQFVIYLNNCNIKVQNLERLEPPSFLKFGQIGALLNFRNLLQIRKDWIRPLERLKYPNVKRQTSAIADCRANVTHLDMNQDNFERVFLALKR